jgi:aminoglycoside phosphotransferase (APT) family kinase protein
MNLPHGFDDNAETARLLRPPPPSQALSWVAEQTGANVESVDVIRGGISSAVHRVHLTTGNGARTSVVLRRYVLPRLNLEEPDIAAREARTLGAIESLDLPTPRLLSVDESGQQCDVPALLMTYLPGQIEWSPPDVAGWLEGLVSLLARIHAADDSVQRITRPYEFYAQDSYDPPTWVSKPVVWERAVEIAERGRPQAGSTFVHRDFHPGNVLWADGRVSGLVDWQSASVGIPDVDVGHCRVNLLSSHDPEVVQRFTHLWEQLAGRTYDPWADVVTIVGFLDTLRDESPSEHPGVEDMLARAVASLRD